MTKHTVPTRMQKAPSLTGPHEGYMPGFGNDFETEALPGALPQGMNSPQKCNYGLYGEQLSGTAFTAETVERTWCYRIRPSVKHSHRYDQDRCALLAVRAQCRSGCHLSWAVPLGPCAPHRKAPLTWITGMRTMTTAGDVNTQVGMASHIYLVNTSMEDDYFFSADSELLVVPQEGVLRFSHRTRASLIWNPKRSQSCHAACSTASKCSKAPPAVLSAKTTARNSNCPAAARSGPTAWPIRAISKRLSRPLRIAKQPSTVTIKWCGQFHRTEIGHSPLDVVAWHGNYAPVKYDLRTYCPVGAILFDHPDPSIFTVLTAPSGVPGTANIDFVLFRERWMVAENTFRPPWYHKNIMSELMGNIYGQYDAKPKGFIPGGMSLHNMMIPHGPDKNAFEGASNADLQAEKLDNTMSFMFETRFPQHLTAFAGHEAPMQDDYIDCWSDLEKKFDGKPR